MKLESVILLVQKYQPDDEVTEYCQKIADRLEKEKIKTHLICFGEEEKKDKQGNLIIHQVPFQLDGDNYFSWSMLVQTEFVRKVKEIKEEENITLIHANDWQTVPASLIASKVFELPLVITYHSIEEERGMDKPHSQHISELEWQGIDESSYIIVHNQETEESLEVYELPEGKIKTLKGDNWKDELYKIYKNIHNVSKSEKELKAKGSQENETFNAYMGVSA